MAHADQLAAIVAAGNTVANIGRIHDRPRYGDAAAHWVTTIDGVPQVRAWEIGIQEGGIRNTRATQSHLHRYTPWEIVGYLTLVDGDINPDVLDADAHYTTAIQLAEAWAAALEADRSLAGSVIDITEPASIVDPEPFRLGGAVLCWAVRIRFETYEIL